MKVALGIPVIDGVSAEAFPSHLAIAVEIARQGQLALFTPRNRMPHDVARWDIWQGAVEQGCDYLLFVDDDNILPIGTFTRLLKVLQDNEGCRVVSGSYLRRGYPYTTVWSKEIKGQYYNVDASEGVHEIHVSGLGCALIDLKWCDTHLTRPIFQMFKDEEGLTKITDDVSFYSRVREAGGLILGDADVQCGHVHERVIITRGNADSLRMLHIKKEGEVRMAYEAALAQPSQPEESRGPDGNRIESECCSPALNT